MTWLWRRLSDLGLWLFLAAEDRLPEPPERGPGHRDAFLAAVDARIQAERSMRMALAEAARLRAGGATTPNGRGGGDR